jgi:hypothetical protein
MIARINFADVGELPTSEPSSPILAMRCRACGASSWLRTSYGKSSPVSIKHKAACDFAQALKRERGDQWESAHGPALAVMVLDPTKGGPR